MQTYVPGQICTYEFHIPCRCSYNKCLNILYIYTQLTVYATEMYAFIGMEYGCLVV